MDDNYFLCDRVRFTQSKKLKGKNVGWKMVYNFLSIDEKTKKNLLTFDQNACTVSRTSVQCIQTKNT